MIRLVAHVVVAGAIVAVASSCLHAQKKRSLDAYLADLAGPGAVKCGLLGVFPTETDAQAAVDCINRHRDTGTPAVMTQVGLSAQVSR